MHPRRVVGVPLPFLIADMNDNAWTGVGRRGSEGKGESLFPAAEPLRH